MDINSLMGTLLSANTVSAVSDKSGASTRDVSSVLTAALPLLMNGVSTQSSNQATVAGFTSALAQHAEDDTSDVNSFMNNVSLSDGAKILGHLLGGNTATVTNDISASTGVSKKKTNSILSSVSPLLMSLLGQGTGTTQASSASATTSLIASLLGNADVMSLAVNLLKNAVSTDTSAETTSAAKKKTSSTGKKTTTAASGKKTTTSTTGKKTASSTTGKKTTTTASGKKVTTSTAKKKTSTSQTQTQDSGIDAADVLNILGKLIK